MKYKVYEQTVLNGRTTNLSDVDNLTAEQAIAKMNNRRAHLLSWKYDVRVGNQGIMGIRFSGPPQSPDTQIVHVYSEPHIRLDSTDHDLGKGEVGPELAAAIANMPWPNSKHPLHTGSFLVKFEDSSHRGYKIVHQLPDAEFAPGENVVSFYTGGNEKMQGGKWVQFAFMDDAGAYRIWQRFNTPSDKMAQIRLGLRMLIQDPGKAASDWATVTGRCSLCNAKISASASIKHGLGPECAKKVGAK